MGHAQSHRSVSGFFIELLTLGEPEKLGSDGFSTLFGIYNRDFIRAAMALRCSFSNSKEAASDAATFSSAGVGQLDTLRFEREAKRPDGTSVKVGFFSLSQRTEPRAIFISRHASNSTRRISGTLRFSAS